MDLNGKIAFVTGGASGIGLAVVEELLKKGVKVVTFLDVNRSSGEDVLKQLKEKFGDDRAVFIPTDVTKRSDLEDAFAKTLDRFGTIDIVFNNAGLVDEVDWDKMLDVQLRAVIAGTHIAYRLLGKHNGGRGCTVINMSSSAALFPLVAAPVYCACKAGVVALSRSYGQPLNYERSGVKVLVVCPGFTATNLFEAARGLDDELEKKQMELTGGIRRQSVETVGRHIVNIISKGDNGSVWYLFEEKAYMVEYPIFADIIKSELAL